MAGRSGSRSHEGVYNSSPPSSDPHDPFSNAQADPRYYDNDSEHDYSRNRDTFGSDSSNNVNEDDRYYEQGAPYDVYGGQSIQYTSLLVVVHALFF